MNKEADPAARVTIPDECTTDQFENHLFSLRSLADHINDVEIVSLLAEETVLDVDVLQDDIRISITSHKIRC